MSIQQDYFLDYWNRTFGRISEDLKEERTRIRIGLNSHNLERRIKAQKETKEFNEKLPKFLEDIQRLKKVFEYLLSGIEILKKHEHYKNGNIHKFLEDLKKIAYPKKGLWWYERLEKEERFLKRYLKVFKNVCS